MNAPAASNTSSSNATYDKMFEALTKSSQSMEKMTQMLLQTQQTQGKAITELQKQMGDVVNVMNQIREQGKFPGGTEPNPAFKTVNAITTRSGIVVRPACECEELEDEKEMEKSTGKIQQIRRLRYEI